MTYTAVVMGPHGSGKTSMLMAAVIHARRLSGPDFKFVTTGRRQVDRPDPPKRPRAALIASQTGAELWAAQEYDRVETAAKIDALAQRLWRAWLHVQRPSGSLPSDAPLPEFSVMSIGPGLIGLEATDGTPLRPDLVEVSGDLFHAFGRPLKRRSAAQDFLHERLSTALRQCDRIVICLPYIGNWSVELRSEIRRIIEKWLELHPRGAAPVLALTKSDVALSRRTLEQNSCIEASKASLSNAMEDLLDADTLKQTYCRSIQSEFGAQVQICSSYGVLTRSGTPNVDLSAASFAPDQNGASIRPLWPRASVDIGELVPSVASSLECWVPLGVAEALFGAA